MSSRVINTVWGPVGLVAQGNQLIRLLGPYRHKEQIEKIILDEFKSKIEENEFFDEIVNQLRQYFAGKPVEFNCTINLSRFSIFARKILVACYSIKPGKTISYSELAQKAGYPGAGRAVGNVMAQNPVPLIIPCHRVIRSDGGLGGYSGFGGISLKKRLLLHENAIVRKKA